MGLLHVSTSLLRHLLPLTFRPTPHTLFPRADARCRGPQWQTQVPSDRGFPLLGAHVMHCVFIFMCICLSAHFQGTTRISDWGGRTKCEYLKMIKMSRLCIYATLCMWFLYVCRVGGVGIKGLRCHLFQSAEEEASRDLSSPLTSHILLFLNQVWSAHPGSWVDINPLHSWHLCLIEKAPVSTAASMILSFCPRIRLCCSCRVRANITRT